MYVILVTQIKGIQLFFYKSVNFRVNDLFKNPHCTKCIGHRTISNMFYERKLYKDSNTVHQFEIRALFIGLPL